MRSHRLVAVLSLLFSCLLSVGAQDTNGAPIVLWDISSTLSSAVGYRENILRSSVASENSLFFLTSVDASLMRYTETGSLFLFYVFGEDTRYFDAPSVNYEQVFSSTAQIVQPVGDLNEAGIEVNYLYQHQILDASSDELDLYRVLVLGHGAYLRSHWKHTMGKWDARIEGTAFRQVFEHELDDYYETEGRVELTRNYGHRSRITAGYAPMLRFYDTREQYSGPGTALPGTELTYFQNEVEGDWRHYWDKRRQWRSDTRLGFMANRDNGPGYFDYDRLQLREQLRWSNGDWEVKATARFGWYHYREQRIGSEHRYRSYSTLGYRIKRRFGEHWMLFTNGEHEWNMSNNPLDDYKTWMVDCGIGYEY